MNSPAEFSREQRLAILRENDGHRTWHALSDRRFCVRCARLFDGSEVKIAECGNGIFALNCPTESCDSNPQHWFFSGSGLDQNGNRTTESSSQAEIDFADR